MGFTLSIQPSLFNKISNLGISPVPAMVEADTTRPSRTGIDRDFEPCLRVLKNDSKFSNISNT